MPEPTSAASFRTFLVAATSAPDLTGVGPDSVTHLTMKQATALDGAAIRKAAESTSAHYVAVVRPGARMKPGWLVRAAEALEDTATAAVAFVTEETGPRTCYDAAATVFDAEALREVGGFLSAFDAEGTDADAYWRIALRGHRTLAEAGWVTAPLLQRLSPAARLALLASNTERETFGRLSPALLLALWNAPVAAAGVDTTSLDLQRSPGGDDVPTLDVPSEALAGTSQMRAFADTIDHLRRSRPVSQSTRRLSDRMLGEEIAGFVDDTWAAIGGDRQRLEAAFFGPLDPAPTTRVAVFGRPPVPGGWIDDLREIGGPRLDVRVLDVAGGTVYRSVDGEWVPKGKASALTRWTEVAVLDGVHIRTIPWLASSDLPILLNAAGWDIESELVNEFPSMAAGTSSKGAAADLLIETGQRVDHVVAGSEEQLDKLLGVLAGLRRVNTLVYDEDNSLLNLVEARSDVGQAVAEFCDNPRRSADLVQSFDRSAQKSAKGVRALAARLTRARA